MGTRNAVRAKLDIIFKKLFADKNHTKLLRSLLEALLDMPVGSIQEIYIMNPDLLPENPDEKLGIMDLKIKVDNQMIDVEIQNREEADYEKRALFYWARMYAEQIPRGENYGVLLKSITINIINFNMFDCEQFNSKFIVKEENRNDYLKDLEIYFFELKKLSRNKDLNKSSRMEQWLTFINAETEEELNMLTNSSMPEIREAVMVLHEMSADEKTQEIARLREKAIRDELAALKFEKQRADREYNEKMREREEKILAQKRAENERERNEKLIEILKAMGKTEEEIEAMLNTSSNEDSQ